MTGNKYIINAMLADGAELKIHEEMFNKAYRKYIFDQSRIQIFFGGGSSGKSTFKFQTVPLDLLLFKRNYLVVTKEKKMAISSCVNEVKRAIAQWHLEDYFSWRSQPTTCTCKLNNAVVQFEGLDDVENLKSIVPITGAWSDVIIEEATNVSENDFDQLMIRQRGVAKDYSGNDLNKRITIIFNPISKGHWIYKRFFSGKWIESKHRSIRFAHNISIDRRGKIFNYKIWVSILKTTYKDNDFLTAEDIATLKNIADPNRYRIYVLGYFGSLGKTIFTQNKNYFIEKNLKENMLNRYGERRMGLDFGNGGVAPYAFVKLNINKAKREIYIFEEISISDVSVPEFCTLLKPLLKDSYERVIVEQGKDIRRQLKEEGIPMKMAHKGKGSIAAGLNFLLGYKIYIDSSCTAVISNFEMYSWRKNRMGEYVEIPEDVNNDSIDALRYAVSYDVSSHRMVASTSRLI